MITEEIIDSELQVNIDISETSDEVICTIISDQHILSSALLDSLQRIHIVPIAELPEHDLTDSHLIIIHDLATSEIERQLVRDILTPFDEKFIVRVTDRPIPECKLDRVVIDSNLSLHGVENPIAICRKFTNTLIESLELYGMVCVDYFDIYCQFCNTGICQYSHARSSSPSNRALEAITQAIPEPITYLAVGAVVIIYAGLNFKLEEFEAIGNYVNKMLPESCSVTIGHRMPLDELDSDTLKVSVFINRHFD
jgi:hypothetical protein